mmetsp:Transcript_36171/g.56663  ORF Transcript_36171/g.56663 Transcript_36171/m.56663 type:complete len:267 (-) Transcript_36171:15-815(-)
MGERWWSSEFSHDFLCIGWQVGVWKKEKAPSVVPNHTILEATSVMEVTIPIEFVGGEEGIEEEIVERRTGEGGGEEEGEEGEEEGEGGGEEEEEEGEEEGKVEGGEEKQKAGKRALKTNKIGGDFSKILCLLLSSLSVPTEEEKEDEEEGEGEGEGEGEEEKEERIESNSGKLTLLLLSTDKRRESILLNSSLICCLSCVVFSSSFSFSILFSPVSPPSFSHSKKEKMSSKIRQSFSLFSIPLFLKIKIFSKEAIFFESFSPFSNK